MMTTPRPLALALLALLALPSGVLSQTPAPPSPSPADPGSVPAGPAALAELVLERLVGGTRLQLEEVYPFEPTLKLQAEAWDVGLEADPPLVLRESGDRALLLLGARPLVGNRGDETVVGRTFSRLYLARRGRDGWRLTDRLPADAGNRILRQSLHVDLDPARGLDVVDTLAVEVVGAHGFGARLNQAAELREARLDGRSVEHAFAGGYLWVDAPVSSRSELVLAYHLPVASDTLGGPNSGRFGPEYGHVRNQYFWHPFFDFDSERDRADFDVTVRAPARFAVVTSLPQRDTVVGDRREVRARSARPTFGLTLLYDAGLERTSARLGDAAVDLLLRPDGDPSPDSVMAAIGRTYRQLGDRFGAPHSPYLVVALTRLRGGGGWHFRSNDLIAAGARPGRIDRGGPYPRAWLGHEVAHGWTAPTGPATNFLSEGWATYAEALLIAERYGNTAEADYWESQRTYYERHGFEGRARLASDPNNSGVSYSKGAWVLRMLRDHVGGAAFDRGLAAYMAIPPGRPAGLEEMVRAVSGTAGRDVWAFLRPWVEEAVIPDLAARVEAGRVVVEQRQAPLFALDVELEIETGRGTERRVMLLRRRADTLSLGASGTVRAVRLDPDHRLLLRRHRGEVLTFRLRAPEADTVLLGGTFLAQPRPAARSADGTWTLRLPLTEGTYGYWWEVDGRYVEPERGERLVVDGVEPMGEEALP